MRRLILAGVLLAPAAAWGQQPPEQLALKLTLPQIVVVARGLGELPYKEVAPLLLEIQKQVGEQMPQPKDSGK